MKLQDYYLGLNPLPETVQFVNEICMASKVSRVTAWRWVKGITPVPIEQRSKITDLINQREKKAILFDDLILDKDTLIARVGDRFFEWAVSFFAPDSGNLDTFIGRMYTYTNYLEKTKEKIFYYSFIKRLGYFVQWASWIDCLCPKELSDENGRILRRNSDNKTEEMLFIRSKLNKQI